VSFANGKKLVIRVTGKVLLSNLNFPSKSEIAFCPFEAMIFAPTIGSFELKYVTFPVICEKARNGSNR
jgi:hypothetical protein